DKSEYILQFDIFNLMQLNLYQSYNELTGLTTLSTAIGESTGRRVDRVRGVIH
ncbi:unnamed protein product, partial [Adineta steineri]